MESIDNYKPFSPPFMESIDNYKPFSPPFMESIDNYKPFSPPTSPTGSENGAETDRIIAICKKAREECREEIVVSSNNPRRYYKQSFLDTVDISQFVNKLEQNIDKSRNIAKELFNAFKCTTVFEYGLIICLLAIFNNIGNCGEIATFITIYLYYHLGHQAHIGQVGLGDHFLVCVNMNRYFRSKDLNSLGQNVICSDGWTDYPEYTFDQIKANLHDYIGMDIDGYPICPPFNPTKDRLKCAIAFFIRTEKALKAISVLCNTMYESEEATLFSTHIHIDMLGWEFAQSDDEKNDATLSLVNNTSLQKIISDFRLIQDNIYITNRDSLKKKHQYLQEMIAYLKLDKVIRDQKRAGLPFSIIDIVSSYFNEDFKDYLSKQPDIFKS